MTFSTGRDSAAGGLFAHPERFMYLKQSVATGDHTAYMHNRQDILLLLFGAQHNVAQQLIG
jgi:hypothetical protein